jgi:hypothetical protein
MLLRLAERDCGIVFLLKTPLQILSRDPSTITYVFISTRNSDFFHIKFLMISWNFISKFIYFYWIKRLRRMRINVPIRRIFGIFT